MQKKCWKCGRRRWLFPKLNMQQRWDMNQLANIVTDLQEQVVSLKKEDELSLFQS